MTATTAPCASAVPTARSSTSSAENTGPELQLELDAQLDHAVGRYTEEVGGPPRIARHDDEQPVAPRRHADAVVCKKREVRQVVRNVVGVNVEAARARVRDGVRHV